MLTEPSHRTNITAQLSISRLSSIDTKYHVWKMGVVFTDNVSWNRGSERVKRTRVFLTENANALLSLLLSQSFLYLVWYTTMSILGHYNNFFFAAHLLDIAMGFKTLRTILSSVTHNGKQVRRRRGEVAQGFFLAAEVSAEPNLFIRDDGLVPLRSPWTCPSSVLTCSILSGVINNHDWLCWPLQ